MIPVASTYGDFLSATVSDLFVVARFFRNLLFLVRFLSGSFYFYVVSVVSFPNEAKFAILLICRCVFSIF